MSLKIKDLPETERPYEKLELYGEKTLSNAELLAIIIKSGTKDETSVQIAQKILNLNYDKQLGELGFLKNISIQELLQIKGIGKVKAIQIKAICELAIRMSKPVNYKKIQIKNTQQIAEMLYQDFQNEKREIVRLFLLNNKNEIIKITDIALGGTNFANVSIKEIVSEALKIKAPKMILVHNHPSGDATPSLKDIQFTDRLFNAARLLEIELLDHIVIGNMQFKSVFLETKERLEKERK